MNLRITILILTGLSASQCQSDEKPAVEADQMENGYYVGFLIMDGVYNTELTAPYDIFHHTIFREGILPMHVFTVAESRDPVRTFEGLLITPDYSYITDDIPPIDILVVPSAEHHLDTDLENTSMIDFVRRTAEGATTVLSLCDGAFVLAQAGLLDSLTSTTFPGDIDAYKSMFQGLAVRSDVSFVHDGKFITSAGGARSFDAALYLVEEMYGDSVAARIATGLVIDWDLNTIRHLKVSEQ